MEPFWTLFCALTTGIHYIGDLLDHKPFRCMLDQMTDGQLLWEPLENPFDHVVLGPPENRRRYPIYSGRNRFPDELKKCFPGEEKAIDEYMRLAKVRSSGPNRFWVWIWSQGRCRKTPCERCTYNLDFGTKIPWLYAFQLMSYQKTKGQSNCWRLKKLLRCVTLAEEQRVWDTHEGRSSSPLQKKIHHCVHF